MERIGVSPSFSSIPDVIAANSKRQRKIYAPLTCSLYSIEGPSPTFYRDTSGSVLSQVVDNYGYLRTIRAGGAPFSKARFVENILRFSELLGYTGTDGWNLANSATIAPVNDCTLLGPDGNQTAWKLGRAAIANSLLKTQSSYTYNPVRHTLSFWARTDSGGSSTMEARVYVSGTTSVYCMTRVVSLNSTWKRFCLNGVPDGTSSYTVGFSAITLASTSSGYCYIAFPQLEEMFDPENFAPSEYVSRDLNPRRKYFFGAAIDGLQFFDTEKGNTFDNSTGVVSEGIGQTLSGVEGILTYPSTKNHIDTSEDFSTYTKSDASVTLTANSTTAPDKKVTATKFDEGTASSTVHYIESAAFSIASANNKQRNWSVYAKSPGTSLGRQWLRLAVVDRSGTLVYCYYDIINGVVGSSSTNTWGTIESLADGWFRLMFSFGTGSGASEITPRIYMAEADGDVTFTGSNKYVWIWGAVLLGSTAADGGDRAIAVPYGKTTSSLQQHPGSGVLWQDLEQILGTTELTFYGEYTPYYLFSQTNKVTYTTCGPYVVCGTPVENTGASALVTGVYSWDRGGITIRPPLSGGSANTKLACDFYQGEVGGKYIWQANEAVSEGTIRLPTSVKPDNSTGVKMFVAVVGGVTGSTEPSWDTTFVSPPDKTTNITVDGSVKWQNSHDNTLTGTWEPYNMCDYLYLNTFGETIRVGWYVTNSYTDGKPLNAFVNGFEFVTETAPIPINPDYGGAFRSNPSKMYLGRINASRGIPNETIPSTIGTTYAELMPTLTGAHKNICVWQGGVDKKFLQQMTNLGLTGV